MYNSISSIESAMTVFKQQGKEHLGGLYDKLQGDIHPAMLILNKLGTQLEKLKTQYGYHQSKSLEQQIGTLTKTIEGITGFLSKASDLHMNDIFDADIKRGEIAINTLLA